MKNKLLIFIFLMLSLVITTFYGDVNSTKESTVLIIPVKGTIDLGLSGFVKRILAESKQEEIKIYIFEIDTFGGRVDAALEICKSIKELKDNVTIAYISGEAWSAGALISLACKDIIMAPGSSIGSAEPRLNMFGSAENATDEKTISAIRAKFKSIAEENNHPQNIAQGMVDKDIELKLVEIKQTKETLTTEEFEELKHKLKKNEFKEIRTVKQKGKLLNLSAKDAKELNLAKEIIEDRNALLKFYNLEGIPIKESHPNWSEILVRFITNPIVSSLLLTLGFLGMIFELKIPGWGLTGTIALICLALFFWGHYLIGLANWIEILIFIAGIILLLAEIFLIPGFGIIGALGITLILLGAFLSLIKHPFQIPKTDIVQALYILTYSLIATFVFTLLIMKFFPHTGIWKKVVLATSEKTQSGYTSAKDLSKYLGRHGKTISILRPSGRAIFGNEILDVITEGDFIDQDKEIQVVSIEGNRIIVKSV
ncbi:MAG: nodulation protein NfeD [Candidatus Omnitrophica bacterium]|nr:nodulation protein NfeD [Candidatus Omnitrophota bacterium]